ncbi:MAG TPA: FHA domain-containing protein [Candidatus Competibacteraceae bacterium]|nr:MAG: FHA domain-containing protein [Candidatus Competibacteraceae bacterium]HOB60672.1 FHA domain-containing protein [Candidatus Competibacteraceae bacterium]HQA26247.1 FHA domain-containing protein [Candidatus Competibacteraceae bacterium]HQD57006.1 FHA domain-containing protein [Candidatus Competibacteraceae bacterium]
MKFNLWSFFRRRGERQPAILVRARFIRTDLPGKGDLWLRSPLCRLGRAPDNDISFDNDSVSGYHAEVYHLPDGTFQLCDLDSTNGAWVNGKRIHSQILSNGDVVELGEVRLHFRTGDR